VSLDAPLVALLWQALFAHTFGIAVPASVASALAVAVWCIYVTDRLLDTARSDARTTRHQFSLRHRKPLAIAVVFGFAVLALVCSRLPVATLRSGWGLGAFVGIYFAAVHGIRLHRFWVPIKEAVVGFTFAAGVTLPVWASLGVHWQLLLPAVLFGCVCTLNCLAIDFWEGAVWEGALWESLLANTNPTSSGHLTTVSACLAGLSGLCLLFSPPALHPIYAALSGASLLLFALLYDAGRFSLASLRVLADLALCTPLLLWLA
jgi:hypothetical protein